MSKSKNKRKNKVVKKRAGLTAKAALLLGLGIGTICGYAGVKHYIDSSSPKNSIVNNNINHNNIPVKKESLEDVITRNASIVKVVNPKGEGNLYLVGMVHYYKENSILPMSHSFYKPQHRSLPFVQSEIYHLLSDLSKEQDLNVVVGEGLGDRETTSVVHDPTEEWLEQRNKMDEKEHAVTWFRRYQKETGYISLEYFHPDLVRTFGVDDKKQMEASRRIKIHMDSLYMASRSGPGSAKIKRQNYEIMTAPSRKNWWALQDERSRIYMKEGIAIADKLGEKDLAIVIGAYHVPLMVKEYEGRRKLYVLRPNSMPFGLFPRVK